MSSVSFEPIISMHSKLLILGTMPGIKSLNEKQYYAHERNAFWLIMFQLLNEPFSILYQKRVELILKNKLALWDTLKFCQRKGSLDSNIKNAEPNEISRLLIQYPEIKNIVFNGKTAEKYFNKFHEIPNGIEVQCLPSTSPANASVKIEQKIARWGVILDLI